MKDTKPTLSLLIKRITGVLRAYNRGDITDTELRSVIARILRETAAADARRTEA